MNIGKLLTTMASGQPVTETMNNENPLANNVLDENPEDMQLYGYDPDGPSPFEDSDNDVVVPPVVIQHHSEILEFFLTVTRLPKTLK